MKRRKPRRRKKAAPELTQHEDLNAASSAVYGMGDGRESPSQAHESKEDPLADWPESAAEAGR